MATYAVTDTQLTSIADAIRSKTGKTDNITVNDMPDEIESISGGEGEGHNKSIVAIPIKSIYINNVKVVLNYEN